MSAYSMGYAVDSLGVYAYSVIVTLGERIRALREERGWSQRELAKRAGLNSQTIHNLEHDKFGAGWKSRRSVAQAFGIPIAAIDPTYSQEAIRAQAGSPTFIVDRLTEKELLEGIVAFTKELEKRRDRPDPPEPPEAPSQPPARHRKRR